jgi:hypothetical protein
MTIAIEATIESRRTGMARPRQRGSVAAWSAPTILRQTGIAVHHATCLSRRAKATLRHPRFRVRRPEVADIPPLARDRDDNQNT